ncbi:MULTISPECIES: cold-shock protein [Nitrospirillum]|uniref:Cold-shock protein n=2 Tax=Nitrospirillum TaxID=1543705 RepID=A0A248JN15_9PROT|nr:cold-shock protein [Nitrospirillum amazonense]ASG19860.1 cold-shock protein [Nitrospirillum amazonense CBAmc]MDG3440821.1 cold shock domain-containing protein [Nitrospirillum amazonense]MEC4590503.1 cold shock domain-containing protein [Nitrospirillum amazonense]TWB16872.1 putative cold-shock DNA-binding protein [Nitrospirillum amazonense]TWB21057.1 putative cold-shock DNA-binding protein [Nitrospirillum amazonense]
MPRFGSYDAFSQEEGLPAKAQVKWFNTSKGFGFVALEDGTPDAFLHISVISRAGLADITEGTELLCTIGAGPKGPQVLRIVEVTGTAAPPERSGGPAPRTRDRVPTGSEIEIDGTVKWFKADKGFGFVLADDGGKDVFVHKSVLRRCGMDHLDEGQRVQMRIADAPKGREAVWVALA